VSTALIAFATRLAMFGATRTYMFMDVRDFRYLRLQNARNKRQRRGKPRTTWGRVK
jgi:hypothetical protein